MKTNIDTHSVMNISMRLLMLVCLFFLAACGRSVSYESPPVKHTKSPDRLSPVDIALQQIGTPYRYGGHSPSGFDCSGLVYYAYRQQGMNVPRSTTQQLSYARKIAYADLTYGDLVFFRISKNKVSHVGIYIGGKKFVHAPSSGKLVQISSLNNKYWRQRIVSIGRI